MITATAILTENIQVTASLGGDFCQSATYTLINTATPPATLGTGSIASGDTQPIVAPDATVLRDGQPFGSVPSGGSINVPVPAVAIREAYTPNLFYIGFGNLAATDQTPITIKRVTVDPTNGIPTEAFAFGPWDDYLTLPYV